MSRLWRRAGLGVIVLLFLAYFGVLAVAFITVGGAGASLAIFLGTVHVQTSSGAASNLAHTGDQLRSSDIVRTGEATKAAVGYPDGSVSRLDSNSFLQVHSISSPHTGAWNIELLQSGGKTWNLVHALASGASFQVDAPNTTTVQVRGTEFEVIVDTQAGATVVRVDSWTGNVDVTAQGAKVQLIGGQTTSVHKGAAPTAAAPISDTDRHDTFTVFNQALDVTGGALVSVKGATISQGDTSPPMAAGTADGMSDLQLTLGWPGSKLELTAVAPDGSDFRKASSDTPPVTIVIQKAAAGSWQYRVHAIESAPAEPYWVLVSWRVRPAWEAAAQDAYTQWATSHYTSVTGSGGGADLTSLEGGPALLMDQSALKLVSIFRGDPLKLIYASGAFSIDPSDEEAYVAGPGAQPETFLAISDVTADRFPTAQHYKVLVVFTRADSTSPWLAMMMGYAGANAIPAIAVGNDGYATLVAPSAQDRFLVGAYGLGSALAADLQAAINGGGSARFPSITDSFSQSAMSSQQDAKRYFNRLEVDKYSVAPEYPPFSFQLANGSALDFVTIKNDITTTPPPGGCVVQPSPTVNGGGGPFYSTFLGPTRGAYGSVTETVLTTLAIEVPPAASGKNVAMIAGTSFVTAWAVTACSGRGTPGSGTGDVAYI
jgi:hypothetical protein